MALSGNLLFSLLSRLIFTFPHRDLVRAHHKPYLQHLNKHCICLEEVELAAEAARTCIQSQDMVIGRSDKGHDVNGRFAYCLFKMLLLRSSSCKQRLAMPVLYLQNIFRLQIWRR